MNPNDSASERPNPRQSFKMHLLSGGIAGNVRRRRSCRRLIPKEFEAAPGVFSYYKNVDAVRPWARRSVNSTNPSPRSGHDTPWRGPSPVLVRRGCPVLQPSRVYLTEAPYLLRLPSSIPGHPFGSAPYQPPRLAVHLIGSDDPERPPHGGLRVASDRRSRSVTPCYFRYVL